MTLNGRLTRATRPGEVTGELERNRPNRSVFLSRKGGVAQGTSCQNALQDDLPEGSGDDPKFTYGLNDLFNILLL